MRATRARSARGKTALGISSVSSLHRGIKCACTLREVNMVRSRCAGMGEIEIFQVRK